MTPTPTSAQGLPELPEGTAFCAGLDATTDGWISVMAWTGGEFTTPLYTADQMHAYARLAVEQALRQSGEAVAWQVRPKSMDGRWLDWTQKESEQEAIAQVKWYERDGVNAECRALYTTPPAAPVDARLVEALRKIAEFKSDPQTPVRNAVKMRSIARAALASHDAAEAGKGGG